MKKAGWYTQDLSKPYLSISYQDENGLSQQVDYNGSNLLWGSFQELLSDLADGYIESGGISRFYAGNYTIRSGGDVFHSPNEPIWKTIRLTQGEYSLSLAADSEAYNLMAYWGDSTWNAYVQLWAAYGDSFAFGDGDRFYDSQESALAYYRDHFNGTRIYLQQDTDVHFYINDWNALDNIGGVTVDVQTSPISEPTTILLLVSGLAGLAGLRKKFARKPLIHH